MTSSFELDLEGGAEVLQVMSAPVISELALQVAGAADDGATADEYAQITEKVGDRFRASVSVPADRQARDGVLTKAAAAAGLEVKLRQSRPRGRRRKKDAVDDEP